MRSTTVRAGEDTRTDSQVSDAISLRGIDSTESGSAPNKEGHRRFTVAFHRAASFTRVDYLARDGRQWCGQLARKVGDRH